mmetsp:Transcript_10063/g.17686  ORF Transcript_10063/g.17686 Transcript_10063/m.17686 type:complete len:404 (+) Transcript_10063:56-1267(+)
MAGGTPQEVLEPLVKKILNSVESDNIRTLKVRRKFLVWKLRDARGSFGILDTDGSDSLYSALVKISTHVDKLREGEQHQKWVEALLSFFASRDSLIVIEAEVKKVDDILATAFKSSRKVGRSGYAASDFESDLRTDLNYTAEVVEKTSVRDLITEEAKEVLKHAQVTFKRAKEKEKMSDVVKMLNEQGGEFEELKKEITKLATRKLAAPVDPAFSQILVPQRPQLDLKLSGDVSPGTSEHVNSLARKGITKNMSPRVFRLDLSTDYKPVATGGFYFKRNQDFSQEITQCYVFLPNTATQVLKTWIARKIKCSWNFLVTDFMVTVDGVEYWVGKNVTKSKGCKTFHHKGHKYTVRYSRDTWSYLVDDNSLPEVLSHQEWVDAKNLHSFKRTMRAVDDIINMDFK